MENKNEKKLPLYLWEELPDGFFQEWKRELAKLPYDIARLSASQLDGRIRLLYSNYKEQRPDRIRSHRRKIFRERRDRNKSEAEYYSNFADTDLLPQAERVSPKLAKERVKKSVKTDIDKELESLFISVSEDPERYLKLPFSSTAAVARKKDSPTPTIREQILNSFDVKPTRAGFHTARHSRNPSPVRLPELKSAQTAETVPQAILLTSLRGIQTQLYIGDDSNSQSVLDSKGAAAASTSMVTSKKRKNPTRSIGRRGEDRSSSRSSSISVKTRQKLPAAHRRGNSEVFPRDDMISPFRGDLKEESSEDMRSEKNKNEIPSVVFAVKNPGELRTAGSITPRRQLTARNTLSQASSSKSALKSTRERKVVINRAAELLKRLDRYSRDKSDRGSSEEKKDSLRTDRSHITSGEQRRVEIHPQLPSFKDQSSKRTLVLTRRGTEGASPTRENKLRRKATSTIRHRRARSSTVAVSGLGASSPSMSTSVGEALGFTPKISTTTKDFMLWNKLLVESVANAQRRIQKREKRTPVKADMSTDISKFFAIPEEEGSEQ